MLQQKLMMLLRVSYMELSPRSISQEKDQMTKHKMSDPKSCFIEMRQQGKDGWRIWRSWVEGEEVVTQWGVQNGKMRETRDTPGPKGKPGTKGYVDAKQSARDQVIRDISKKAREGYKLLNELSGWMKASAEAEISKYQTGQEVNFDGPLPQNLCFSKPVNSIDHGILLNMLAEEAEIIGGPKIVWTIKVNGMGYVVSKDKHDKVWIQSRGKMKVCNDQFPHLVEEFDALLPPESIFLAEFFMGNGRGKKDFSMMQQIANSLPEEALRKQKQLGLVHAYVYRNPYWKGARMEFSSNCSSWIEFIEALHEGWEDPVLPGGQQVGFMDCDNIMGIVAFEGSYEDAMAQLDEHGYEGFVIYRRDKPLGERSLNFQGDPDRPAVCWKVKPSANDDFIAYWDPDGMPAHCSSKCHYTDLKQLQESMAKGRCQVCNKKLQPDGSWGTGKNQHRVGSLSLYQSDHRRVKQYICDVASGINDRLRNELADVSKYPIVVEVEYKDRGYVHQGDDSNALQHPVFLRVRKDKDLNECINNDL